MAYYQRQSMFSTPPAVLNLLIINGLVYMAMVMIPKADFWMIKNFGLFSWESPMFRPWQLVTHMFLHGRDMAGGEVYLRDMHIISNMFALWMFGRAIEWNMGTRRFLTYYFITGIGAGILQLMVNWIDISVLQNMVAQGSASAYMELQKALMTPTIGASGAVFGILLAFGLMYPNTTIMLLIPPIPMKAKYFVIAYGVFELFAGISGAMSGIAHFAHVGGMVFGFFLLRYWKRKGFIYY